MAEVWDIYDENRNKTGRTMIRGEEVKKGDYHLVVHVCIFNSKGEMLIQKRTLNKKSHPGMWDVSVGGSAISGDSSQTAAERETLEEIGLKINLQNKRPRLTLNFDEGFDDVYLIKKDLNIEELKLQPEEVSEVKWAKLDEILEMLKTNKFVTYDEELLRLLFKWKNKN